MEATLRLRELRDRADAERRGLLEREQIARREAEEKTEIVETINRIGQRLAVQTDLNALVQSFTDEATRLAGAQFGAFFHNLVDDKGESYTLYTLSGVPRSAFEGFPLPRNTEVFGPTFRGERIIRLDDVQQDPRYGQNAPHHGMPRGHLPVTSYLAVPVVSRTGEVIGGLFLGHERAGVFAGAPRADHGRGRRAAGHRHRQRAAAREGAARARGGRGGEPRQGRVPRRALARAAHAAQRGLGWAQHAARARRRRRGDAATRALDIIERNAQRPGPAHRGPARRLPDRHRQAAPRASAPSTSDGVVDAALEAVRPAAEAKGIRLQVGLDPERLGISGDPDRLQQVVWNLLINAVKFTPAGGRVQVTAARGRSSRVEIVVSDYGQGIAPDVLPHVFERFRQADSTSTTRAHGGLGLGLAIVRHLVELHGGTVRGGQRRRRARAPPSP